MALHGKIYFINMHIIIPSVGINCPYYFFTLIRILLIMCNFHINTCRPCLNDVSFGLFWQDSFPLFIGGHFLFFVLLSVHFSVPFMSLPYPIQSQYQWTNQGRFWGFPWQPVNTVRAWMFRQPTLLTGKQK